MTTNKKEKLVKIDKVKERRELKLKKALEKEDWDEILRLLHQEEENYERKSREYGLLSLDYQYHSENKTFTIQDFLEDSSSRPDIALEKKEFWEQLKKLPEEEIEIFLSKAFDGKTFTDMAAQSGEKATKISAIYHEVQNNLKIIYKDYREF